MKKNNQCRRIRPLALLILGLVIIAIFSSTHSCEAREIVATNEWQKVEEGDTIPSGLHVRMDLETGTKWVKILNENDEEEEQQQVYANDPKGGSLVHVAAAEDNGADQKEDGTGTQSSLQQAVKITQLANAELSADARASITSQLLDQSNRQAAMDSIAALNDFEGDQTKGELEYEMMYRTLLSLPKEEHDSMGMQLPSALAENASDDEKKIFEARVRAIWGARQDLLKQMEEEYLADVTDIIAERITSLEEYVANPMKHIDDVLALRESTDGEDLEGLSTIIDVLTDLEFQLTDLDNSRDFHNMGGWPLLVAFLTDAIHGLEYKLQEAIAQKTQQLDADALNTTDGSVAIELADDTIQYLNQYQKVAWEIQAKALWCMGTAVKNVEEFHPWATEDFSSLMAVNADGGVVNVITILLGKLHSESTSAPSILGMSATDSDLQMRRKFEMYALGSLLRGNREAIHYFNSIEGPSILYDLFSYLKSDTDDISNIDLTTLKLLSKVISLADDLIMDVTLHPSVGSDWESQLVSALTTPEWCIAPMEVMKYPSENVRRKMLETMINMAPLCSYSQHSNQLIDGIIGAISTDENQAIDEELKGLVSKLEGIVS